LSAGVLALSFGVTPVDGVRGSRTDHGDRTQSDSEWWRGLTRDRGSRRLSGAIHARRRLNTPQANRSGASISQSALPGCEPHEERRRLQPKLGARCGTYAPSRSSGRLLPSRLGPSAAVPRNWSPRESEGTAALAAPVWGLLWVVSCVVEAREPSCSSPPSTRYARPPPPRAASARI
jgi:hypothetical protein